MAVAIGAACAARLTSVRRMRAYVATRRWYRGICLAREAVELAVEGARSPQEDRFRLIWELDAGWGRPLLNRDVFDEHGRWVATPDLLDPVRYLQIKQQGRVLGVVPATTDITKLSPMEYIEATFRHKGMARFDDTGNVVVGDGKGRVGFGHGKAREVPEAITKATAAAKKKMIRVPLKEGRTLHHDGKGRFFAPTVAVDTDHAMAIAREESFGPVVAIQKVSGAFAGGADPRREGLVIGE